MPIVTVEKWAPKQTSNEKPISQDMEVFIIFKTQVKGIKMTNDHNNAASSPVEGSSSAALMPTINYEKAADTTKENLNCVNSDIATDETDIVDTGDIATEKTETADTSVGVEVSGDINASEVEVVSGDHAIVNSEPLFIPVNGPSMSNSQLSETVKPGSSSVTSFTQFDKPVNGCFSCCYFSISYPSSSNFIHYGLSLQRY